MNQKNNNFKQLKIWQKGISLVKDIYKTTGHFPDEEKFTLISQMRRSAISIPSNIAEGFKRCHKKEFHQFLNISLGSLAELETQIIISKELGYISVQKLSLMEKEMDQISRMIHSLISKLK